MLKKLRIAVLLYVLLFVAVGSYLATARSTDWDQPLWVDVYPVNADGTPTVRAYIDGLDESEFAALEGFLAEQAHAYGIALDRPFRFVLAPELERELPAIPNDGSRLHAVVWSLKMRWLAARLGWESARPTPDIVLLAAFHDPDATPVVERSTALRKGLIAIANVFADRGMRGSNRVIMAHELLHTLGATDKYDPATNRPLFPIGYADPEREPLHPQARAELMAGRIPLDRNEATIPRGLREVMVGSTTAREIGWSR